MPWASHRPHVEELLVRHHEQRSLQRICRAWSLDRLAGSHALQWDAMKNIPPRAPRLSVIADREIH